MEILVVILVRKQNGSRKTPLKLVSKGPIFSSGWARSSSAFSLQINPNRWTYNLEVRTLRTGLAHLELNLARGPSAVGRTVVISVV